MNVKWLLFRENVKIYFQCLFFKSNTKEYLLQFSLVITSCVTKTSLFPGEKLQMDLLGKLRKKHIN